MASPSTYRPDIQAGRYVAQPSRAPALELVLDGETATIVPDDRPRLELLGVYLGPDWEGITEEPYTADPAQGRASGVAPGYTKDPAIVHLYRLYERECYEEGQGPRELTPAEIAEAIAQRTL